MSFSRAELDPLRQAISFTHFFLHPFSVERKSYFRADGCSKAKDEMTFSCNNFLPVKNEVHSRRRKLFKDVDVCAAIFIHLVIATLT